MGFRILRCRGDGLDKRKNHGFNPPNGVPDVVQFWKKVLPMVGPSCERDERAR